MYSIRLPQLPGALQRLACTVLNHCCRRLKLKLKTLFQWQSAIISYNSLSWSALKLWITNYKPLGTRATIARCSPVYIPVVASYKLPNLNELGSNILPWQPVLDVFRRFQVLWHFQGWKQSRRRASLWSFLDLLWFLGLTLEIGSWNLAWSSLLWSLRSIHPN